ncbi:MAG: hypothetical protein QM770_16615 [Tepidisphaeraceae bacterium]
MGSNRGIAIHWLWLVALTAIPCGLRWRRFLSLLSRPKRGLCLRCGYDLRGSSEGRCSECGSPAASPS